MQTKSIAISFVFLFGFTTGCKFKTDDFWYKDRPESSFTQIDRVGMPGITLLFYGDEDSSEFNTSDPDNDIEDFRETLITALEEKRAALELIVDFPSISSEPTPTTIVDSSLPDVMTIDLSKEIGFDTDNGRRHGDQVMDDMINSVYGTKSLTSKLDDNPDLFEDFPYLVKETFSTQ